MFDFGMGELLIIGVVALIVVGPKDLPVLFRQVGTFVGKARAMGREFSNAMNQAAKDSGMDDVKSTLEGAGNAFQTATNPVKGAADALAEHAKAAAKFDPDSETGKLAAERAEAAKKIHEETAKRQAAKRAAEAAAEAEADMADAADVAEPVEPKPDSKDA